MADIGPIRWNVRRVMATERLLWKDATSMPRDVEAMLHAAYTPRNLKKAHGLGSRPEDRGRGGKTADGGED